MPKKDLNISVFSKSSTGNLETKGLLKDGSSEEPKQPPKNVTNRKATKRSPKKPKQEKLKVAPVSKTIYLTQEELDIIDDNRGYEPFSKYVVRMLREKAKVL